MAKAALIRSTCRVALAGLVSLCFCGAALCKDANDGDDEPAKADSTPNLYLDCELITRPFPPARSRSASATPRCSRRSRRSQPSRLSRRFRRCRPCHRRQAGASASMFRSRSISTIASRSMADSAPALRAPTYPTGRRSRSTAGWSDSRLMSISKMADRSRPLRCSRR